jgi:mono/diheme cytochrome c family protein
MMAPVLPNAALAAARLSERGRDAIPARQTEHRYRSAPMSTNSGQPFASPALVAAAVLVLSIVGAAPARAQSAEKSSASEATAVFARYCVSCHNARLKTAGLVLDPSEAAHPGATAEAWERWEKVVRKLRSSTMPPAGAPRPAAPVYEATASFLEQQLDRAAASRPNPGSLPLLHRLSRTEYQNAVRDLVAIDHLPKELDYSLLLPDDNVSSGFDNIADLLFVSPTTMERYVEAAHKLSRLAIGDPTMPPMVNIHRLSPEQWQGERIEDLSPGTRGGLAVQSYFPLDAEYLVKVDVAGVAREPHQLEVTVDNERVQLATVGANGSGARGGRGAPAGRPQEFRVRVKAGPHLVGVTFIEHTQARDEETLRPRLRGRGTLPAVASVTISGPYNSTGPGDTPSRRRVFVCAPTAAVSRPAQSASSASGSADDELACANRILGALARRAFRRPANQEDIDRLLPFFSAGRAEGGFERGIQRALERILVSPQFLFRIEREPANAIPETPYRVADLELASRLSFFLWSSSPDDELIDAAVSGQLKSPDALDRQVRRMLADPRSDSLVTNFAAQWLFLRDIDAKQPDELLFPDFDETLRGAFRRETELFLASILRENRSVLELLTANYTFVNQRLAAHYGIPNVVGSDFRRVAFAADSPRGGLLGQGSVLTLTSYATRTSPVLRGKWVLDNLLASPPPPPPPNIPALKTEGSEPGRTLSMREAMTQHRANPACASCHARMDPIGFALENFDAVGKWRTRDGGAAIDSKGVLPDGSVFEGVSGLKRALVVHPEAFASAVTEKLLMYALGRNLQYFDAPAVRRIVGDAAASNYTLGSLVSGVVASVPFQMRSASTPTAHDARNDKGAGRH